MVGITDHTVLSKKVVKVFLSHETQETFLF